MLRVAGGSNRGWDCGFISFSFSVGVLKNTNALVPSNGTNAKSVVPPELGWRKRSPQCVGGCGQPRSLRVCSPAREIPWLCNGSRPARATFLKGDAVIRLGGYPLIGLSVYPLTYPLPASGFTLQLRGPFRAVVSGRAFTACLLSGPSCGAYLSSSQFLGYWA